MDQIYSNLVLVSIRESEPNKIICIQQCLQQPAPLLQAVLVCLAPGATQQIPRPSQLRVGPGQLGAQEGGSSFYLNPLLRCKLDQQLRTLMASRKVPPVVRLRHLLSLPDERRVVAVLRRAVDSGAAWQVQYGSLDTPLAKCNSVKLPRLLSSQAVTNIQLVKDAVKIKVLLPPSSSWTATSSSASQTVLPPIWPTSCGWAQ